MQYPVDLADSIGKYLYKDSQLIGLKIPKNCALTDTQLVKLSELVHHYDSHCPTEDARIFAKLVGLGWIIECQKPNGIFYYHLTGNGFRALVELVPVHRNYKHVCGKCGGTGRIREYAHIAAGVCFACNGSGVRRMK